MITQIVKMALRLSLIKNYGIFLNTLLKSLHKRDRIFFLARVEMCVQFYMVTEVCFTANPRVTLTARHVIHLQFDISSNTLQISVVLSPKCMV
jgi:hypothetical protein